MRICGIYKIEHIASGRVYVGSSHDIDRRWVAHRSLLTRGKHHSRYLQAAWLKYGADAFRMSVLAEVPIEELHEAETRHIEEARKSGVFNTAPVGGSTRGMKMPPFSAEHRRKIGDAHIGRVVTADTRALISAIHKGKVISEEHKRIVGEAARTRVHSDETRRKLSEKARNISDDTRRKRSETRKASMTDEFRRRQSEYARNISDETRQKRSEAVRLSWAARKAAAQGGG